MQRLFLAEPFYRRLLESETNEKKLIAGALEVFLNTQPGGEIPSSLKPIQAGDSNTYTLAVSHSYQALLKLLSPKSEEDATWVVLGLASPTEMANYAATVRLGWDGELAEVVRLSPKTKTIARENPFSPFTADELKHLGVAAGQVASVQAFSQRDDLASLQEQLPGRAFYRLAAIAEKLEGIGEDVSVLDEKTKAAEVAEIETEITQGLEDALYSDRFCLVENAAHLRMVCEKTPSLPMVFPSPEQKKWMTRNQKGCALIRGVSGSGKTTLALQRALYLATEMYGDGAKGEKILIVTPFKQTALLLREELENMAHPLANHIEINDAFDWAADVLKAAGTQIEINLAASLETLKDAIDQCRPGMPNIAPFHLDFGFVRDEISQVIKARALYSQPEYLDLGRRNFGTPLSQEERRHMWRIYRKYQELLAEKHVGDHDDLLIEANKLFKSKKIAQAYSTIIVDDVQDMPPVALQMFYQLTLGKPNGLFLLSDASQKITRTGEVLSKLGIPVGFRSPLLRGNFRNTQEIIATSMKVLGHLPAEEIDGQISPEVQPEFPAKHGPMPFVKTHDSEEQEILWVIDLIRELTQESHGYKNGDIAVFVRSNRYLTILELNLTQVQIPMVNFRKSTPDHSPKTVKLVNYLDCKGMQFPVVVLTELNEGVFPKIPTGIDADEMAAHVARETRILYNSMSRAEERLFLTTQGGTPSRFIEPLMTVVETAEVAQAAEA